MRLKDFLEPNCMRQCAATVDPRGVLGAAECQGGRPAECPEALLCKAESSGLWPCTSSWGGASCYLLNIFILISILQQAQIVSRQDCGTTSCHPKGQSLSLLISAQCLSMPRCICLSTLEELWYAGSTGHVSLLRLGASTVSGG